MTTTAELRASLTKSMFANLKIIFNYDESPADGQGSTDLKYLLGVGFAALNTGNNLLYLVFALMLAFLVLSGILSETSLRQSLLMNHGSPTIFFNRPMAGPIMVVALLLLIWPAVMVVRRRMRAASNAT